MSIWTWRFKSSPGHHSFKRLIRKVRPFLCSFEIRWGSRVPGRTPGLEHSPRRSPARRDAPRNTDSPSPGHHSFKRLIRKVRPFLCSFEIRWGSRVPGRTPGLEHSPRRSPARRDAPRNTDSPSPGHHSFKRLIRKVRPFLCSFEIRWGSRVPGRTPGLEHSPRRSLARRDAPRRPSSPSPGHHSFKRLIRKVRPFLCWLNYH